MSWFFFILAVVIGFAICYFTIARKHKTAAQDYKGWYQNTLSAKNHLIEVLDAKETQLQEALGRLEATPKADVKKVTSKVAKAGGRKGAAIATAS